MRPSLLNAFAVFLLAACSTEKGFVHYDEIGVYSSDVVGNKQFKDVGPITADHSSWIWASCDTVATEVVRVLLDVAKSRGANTVYKIRFETDNGLVSTPTCYKRWGWFVLYIVPGLGPWMTHSSAEGIAATITNASKDPTAIFIDKDADTNLLAKTYVESISRHNAK